MNCTWCALNREIEGKVREIGLCGLDSYRFRLYRDARKLHVPHVVGSNYSRSMDSSNAGNKCWWAICRYSILEYWWEYNGYGERMRILSFFRPIFKNRFLRLAFKPIREPALMIADGTINGIEERQAECSLSVRGGGNGRSRDHIFPNIICYGMPSFSGRRWFMFLLLVRGKFKYLVRSSSAHWSADYLGSLLSTRCVYVCVRCLFVILEESGWWGRHSHWQFCWWSVVGGLCALTPHSLVAYCEYGHLYNVFRYGNMSLEFPPPYLEKECIREIRFLNRKRKVFDRWLEVSHDKLNIYMKIHWCIWEIFSVNMVTI